MNYDSVLQKYKQYASNNKVAQLSQRILKDKEDEKHYYSSKDTLALPDIVNKKDA